MDIETQEMSEWCWAAVSVSVDRFFNPGSGVRQCDVAQQVLNLNSNCCGNKQACNEPALLQDALKAIGRFKDAVGRRLRFTEIQTEINIRRRPVCVRIGWEEGGGHFVMIDQFIELTSGDQLVHVLDPLYPNSLIHYDDFVSEYQGDGRWTGTFFVS